MGSHVETPLMRIYHASCTGVFHWDQRKQIIRNGWERAHGPPTVIAVREGRGERTAELGPGGRAQSDVCGRGNCNGLTGEGDRWGENGTGKDSQVCLGETDFGGAATHRFTWCRRPL